MPGLKIICGQQIQQEQDHYLLKRKVINTYYVFTKYAWVKPLKDKKAKTFLHGFVEIVDGSKRKPNKSWVGQGR